MFFCAACATANRWPESHFKSYGTCEECGRQAECNDVPSRFLPSMVVTITAPEEDNGE